MFVCFLVSLLTSNTVLAEKNYSVTGRVESVERKFAKIKVAGKRYNLSRTLHVGYKNRRGEVEPTIHVGDLVGLVFTGSSSSSAVKEVLILSGARE